MSAAISLGAGLRDPSCAPLDLDGDAALALGCALHLHAGREAWWSPSTFSGRRSLATWEGAWTLAVDVDHEPSHRGGAWSWRDRLRARRALARAPGMVAHMTPRGLRVAVMLAEPITDAATFERAARAHCARVGAWVEHEGLAGLEVDEAASCDRARLLYAPRATVDGRTRRARVVECGAGVVALDALLAEAPAQEDADEREAIGGEVTQGARNVTLTRLAGGLRRAGLDGHELRAALLAANTRRCLPPLGEPEVSAIARSVARYPAGEAPPEAAQPVRIEAVSVGADWYDVEPRPREYLLHDERTDERDGVIPLGVAAMLAARGGGGKTMLLAQLAIAVATATPWLGAWSPTAPGRVLLALGEEDADEARRRLHYAARAACVSPPEGSIAVMPLRGVECALLARSRTGDPVETPWLGALRDYVQRHGPWSLVALDPLSRFGGAEAETSNAWGTRLVQAAESLIAPSGGATVLLAHHTAQWARRKNADDRDEATAARGVTGLVDGPRWTGVMTVDRVPFEERDVRRRLGRIVTLSAPKANYSPEGDAVVCRYGEHGVLVPLDDEDRNLVEQARANAQTRPERERRQAREAERDAVKGGRGAEDAATARRIAAERPGVATGDLEAAVMAARNCGRDRARAAIAGAGLVSEPVPGRAHARAWRVPS